jgi:hypothetical protein
MRFDDFVNKILREATFSTQPKDVKNVPTTTPKDGLSAITGVSTQGTPVNQQQVTQQGQVAQQPQKQEVDSSDQDTDSSDAIEGLADAIEKGNKQQEDFYKKMIATMTAQKAQSSTTTPAQTTSPTTAPATNVPNAQQIIANLSKLGQ